MTKEEKLNEAMKLFQEWSNTYSHELVTMTSNLYSIEVTLFHKCNADVAKQIEKDAMNKVKGQYNSYIHAIQRNQKQTISIVWEKED